MTGAPNNSETAQYPDLVIVGAGLIRHAGVGVALGNAVDAAKRAADYVTATVDDDGVLRALQHYGVL